jgi:hypothetical protein
MITAGCVRNASITTLAPNFVRSYVQITGPSYLGITKLTRVSYSIQVADAGQVGERPFHVTHEICLPVSLGRPGL